MRKIFIIGGVSYDTILHLEKLPQPVPQSQFLNTYNESVGSTGSGKALNLNRLGFDVTFHGTIGEDYYGRTIKSYFEKENLKFLYDSLPNGTQRHVNLMDKNGGRISYMMNSTFDPMIDMKRLEEEIIKSDYVVINIINYCRKAIPAAKKANKEIWTDLHDYDGTSSYHDDFIKAAEYITFSSDNMPDYRPFMQKCFEEGKKLVVCTHGSKGSTALTSEGKWIETPVMRVDSLADTNGAGDSFFSGLMYGVLNGYPIETALKLGTVLGGLCVRSNELFDTELTEEKLIRSYRDYYRDGTLQP